MKIRDQDEFDAYMAKMTLKGFGGTDFRPVFKHVDMLIKQHEFTNLKGIIYFTDGYGTFPPMPPEYERRLFSSITAGNTRYAAVGDKNTHDRQRH